jgi:hypothetical protein
MRQDFVLSVIISIKLFRHFNETAGMFEISEVHKSKMNFKKKSGISLRKHIFHLATITFHIWPYDNSDQ